MTENEPRITTVHKEEASKRIAADQKDRESVLRSLSLAIDHLDPEQHPSGKLLNSITGEIADEAVNNFKALNIGGKIVKDFRESWPTGLYGKLPKSLVIDKKKYVVIGDKKLYDQEMIYARIIGLLSSNRAIPIEICLSTELAAYPPSLFGSAGMMPTSSCPISSINF